MAELVTITDKWSEQFWFSTGGTRAKKYLQAPDGKFYYFKRSQYKPSTETKPGKDFTYEFWNEIIAYELGTMLGFNMLRYDIATDGEVMGCISESMINGETEELVEGVKYLQAVDEEYNPVNKDHRSKYDFQLIIKVLDAFKLSEEIKSIIAMLIFDSLIGNGDRHQENWAIINQYSSLSKVYKDIQEDAKMGKYKKRSWLARKLSLIGTILTKDKSDLNSIGQSVKLYLHKPKCMAPIYDSGSSLGRELTDERVDQLLSSREELNRYIDKGLSEIHWEGKKLGHFELLVKIKGTNYSDNIASVIKKIIEKFNPEKLLEIIKNIDEKVPESYSYYKIPEKRKELIFKIITLRFEKLQQLVHEGI